MAQEQLDDSIKEQLSKLDLMNISHDLLKDWSDDESGPSKHVPETTPSQNVQEIDPNYIVPQELLQSWSPDERIEPQPIAEESRNAEEITALIEDVDSNNIVPQDLHASQHAVGQLELMNISQDAESGPSKPDDKTTSSRNVKELTTPFQEIDPNYIVPQELLQSWSQDERIEPQPVAEESRNVGETTALIEDIDLTEIVPQQLRTSQHAVGQCDKVDITIPYTMVNNIPHLNELMSDSSNESQNALSHLWFTCDDNEIIMKCFILHFIGLFKNNGARLRTLRGKCQNCLQKNYI